MSLHLSESEYRALARELLEFAGGGPAGLPQTNPRYLMVTEGREPLHSQFGTSCGELPHWELFRLGVRLAGVINRVEAFGYHSGLNIWRISSAPFTRDCKVDDVYQPGDTVYIWARADTRDAHSMCVIEYDPTELVLTVAEYGQPGAALHTHKLRPGTTATTGKDRPALLCGNRPLQKWVPLMAALEYAEAHGALVEPETSCLNVPDAPVSGDAA